MLKVEKEKAEFGTIIKISDDMNAFKIMFGGNGDLYFAPIMNRMELFEEEIPIYFHITREDGFLFEAFERLYTKICNYDAFDWIDFFEEEDMSMDADFSIKNDNSEIEYQRRKDSSREYPLVNNGIISWHSDEDSADISSILNIKKVKEDTFQLEFIKSKPEDAMYMTYAIRFRNSGSTYDPFNFRFMELYNNLCSYYSEKEEKLSTKIYK